MLNSDPYRRITAAEALKNPWISVCLLLCVLIIKALCMYVAKDKDCFQYA